MLHDHRNATQADFGFQLELRPFCESFSKNSIDWENQLRLCAQITKEILCLPYQCRDTFINEKGEDMDNVIVDQDTYGNQWMYFWMSAYGNKIIPKKSSILINCPKMLSPCFFCLLSCSKILPWIMMEVLPPANHCTMT